MGLPVLGMRAALLLGVLVGAALAGDLQANLHDAAGKAVANAVVIARPLDQKDTSHATVPSQAVDQVDKQFVPYVTAIYAGSSILFPNSDKVRHQVYSFSPAKKFELPLYAGRDAPPVQFNKPGVVVLGCNIHDWMIGYIYVTDTPYFAVSASEGRAVLRDLPAGRYRVSVWHPELQGPEDATVRILTMGSEASEANWQLGIKQPPRVPRVSGSAASAYP